MVTSPDKEAATPGKAGKGKGKKGKGALSVADIDQRVQAVKDLGDSPKARGGRQRVVRMVLNGIANGRIEDPAKAAQSVMTLMPERKPKAKSE